MLLHSLLPAFASYIQGCVSEHSIAIERRRQTIREQQRKAYVDGFVDAVIVNGIWEWQGLAVLRKLGFRKVPEHLQSFMLIFVRWT